LERENHQIKRSIYSAVERHQRGARRLSPAANGPYQSGDNNDEGEMS